MIFKIVFEQGTVIADLIRNELILKSPAEKIDLKTYFKKGF